MKRTRTDRVVAINAKRPRDIVAVRPDRDGIQAVRRVADPARRQRLVRLLSLLLDMPATPDNGR